MSDSDEAVPVVAVKGRARTKLTARKSTGGMAPRRAVLLPRKSATIPVSGLDKGAKKAKVTNDSEDDESDSEGDDDESLSDEDAAPVAARKIALIRKNPPSKAQDVISIDVSDDDDEEDVSEDEDEDGASDDDEEGEVKVKNGGPSV